MRFRIRSIVATAAFPVRHGNTLAPVAPLFPAKTLGLYAEAEKGQEVMRVVCELAGLSAAERGRSTTLVGKLGAGKEALLFTSAKFTAAVLEKQPIAVFLTASPKGFIWWDDAVTWEVRQGGRVRAKFATVLALCFLPATPVGASLGVPHEALEQVRRALDPAGSASVRIKRGRASRIGYSDPMTDVAAICNWLFSRNPPRYDCYTGAPHYVTNAGNWNALNLNYSGYMTSGGNPGALCNCYDMAAVLQYQVQFSVGISAQFSFLQPFGYLALTNLIGRGSCNNPFYLNPPGGPIIIGRTDSGRTAFGNHSFVYFPGYGVVADACAGPHTGTETPGAYLTVAIDGTTPTPPKVNRGTVTQIQNYIGVTTISAVLTSATMPDIQRLLSFVASVGYEDVTHDAVPQHLGAMPDIRLCPFVGPDWAITSLELTPGHPIAGKHVALSKGDARIDLKIRLASDSSRTAHSHFLWLGSTHQMAGSPFGRGPATLGESSASLEAPEYARYLWVARNIVFDLEVFRDPTGVVPHEPLKIAQWLHDTTLANARDWVESDIPTIRAVRVSKKRVRVGDGLTLTVDCSEALALFMDGDMPGIVLVSETARVFRLRARAPSSNRVTIYGVDPVSLLSCRQDLRIRVEAR